MAEIVRKLALTLIPMILSLSVHECAHALCAYKLGDNTAKEAGRLTLNPQVHIDLWGTLVIPALAVISGGMGFIGWARPTPFRADRFRPGVNPRFGAALVSVAGPVSNLLLAVVALGMVALGRKLHLPLLHSIELIAEDGSLVRSPLALFLYSMFTLNVGLAIFNLLPIPPLDGHRLLPPFLDPIVRPLHRYGFALLFAVFLFLPRVANVILFTPMVFVMHHLQALFGV